MRDYSALCAALAEQGYFVWPNFLSEEQVSSARADIADLEAQGRLTHAGIGRGAQLATNKSVRGDQTYWLSADESTPIRRTLLSATEEIRQTLNLNLFLGVESFEGHYAHYSLGSGYVRHSDVFKSTDARVVSLVLYLNDADWAEDDGGQLRIYLPTEDGGERHFDVLPERGKLVCFLSQDFEHEVLRANRDRFSFTGWFRRRP